MCREIAERYPEEMYYILIMADEHSIPRTSGFNYGCDFTTH